MTGLIYAGFFYHIILKAPDKTSKIMATKIIDEMYRQETEMGINFLIKHRKNLEINKEK